MSKLIIRNGQVVTSTDIVIADLLVENEKILGLVAPDTVTWEDAQVIDATNCYVLPGLVDPHTHIQLDTGVFETADDWEIGTKTAAYGGVTTVVDFATQFPDMTFSEALEQRLRESRPAYIDYSYHMMVTDPPSSHEDYHAALVELRDLGIPSIKLYTTYRPNYYMDDAKLLRTFEAMPRDMLAMVHCENDAIITATIEKLTQEGNTTWEFHGKSRPWQAEIEAVERVIRLALLADAAVYIVHCTLPTTLKYIHEIRQKYDGHRILFETCPQYFTLNDSRYNDFNPHHFILQPPLRSPEHMYVMRYDQVLVDVISTDHCDYSLQQKEEQEDFRYTPGGLPGLETSLQLVYTYTDLSETQKMHHIVNKMSTNPAKIFGLYPKKGALLPGSHADIVIYDPEPEITLRAANLHTVGSYTPYEGLFVQGKVRTTISRGEVLVHQGEFLGKTGRGKFLKAMPFNR